MDLDNMMNILVCDDNGDYYYYSSDDDDSTSTFSSSGSFSEEADLYLSRLKDFWNEEEEEDQEENYKDVNDLEYEILTRVDNLDTLLHGCRWVCKDWQRLMYETNFKQLHSQRTPTISGYYIQNYAEGGSYRRIFVSRPQMEDYQHDHHGVVLEQEEEDVEIVSDSFKEINEMYVFPSLDFMPMIVASPPHGVGGLLLCHDIRTYYRDEPSYYGTSYYVCKPTTLEWVKIPPRPLKEKYYLKREEIVVKPRLDPTIDPLHYQIIIFSCQDRTHHGRRRRSCIHTFDSNSWAWKEFEDLNFPPLSFTSEASGVLVNGALHWLRYTGHGILASIFLYRVIEQSWSTIPLPQEQIQTHKRVKWSFVYYLDSKLVDYQGKVGLLCMNMKWIQLWMLLNHPHHQATAATWKKIYLLDMEPHILSRSKPIDLYTSDIIVMLCDENVKWYNLKTNTCITKKLPKNKLRTNSLPRTIKWFALQSDFIPCNWRQH